MTTVINKRFGKSLLMFQKFEASTTIIPKFFKSHVFKVPIEHATKNIVILRFFQTSLQVKDKCQKVLEYFNLITHSILHKPQLFLQSRSITNMC